MSVVGLASPRGSLRQNGRANIIDWEGGMPEGVRAGGSFVVENCMSGGMIRTKSWKPLP